MKKFLLLPLIFYCLQSSAQSGVIKIRKKLTKSVSINGFTEGAVQPQLLCEGKGIYVTNSLKYTVTSFVILLQSVKEIERIVQGNTITGELCDLLYKMKTGDIIHINKIIAFDKDSGKEVVLPSLRFQVRGLDKSEKQVRYDQWEQNK